MAIIAVDAMGGDNAPQAIIQGCIEAIGADPALNILLCGPQDTVKECLGGFSERIAIVHAPDVISNHDQPTTAIRRMGESSLVKALMLVKNGEADAIVTAGSTGATLAGGIFRVGRIRGIDRPALAPLLPTAKGNPAMLIDCGANMDCKPSYLLDFAVMGSAYMKGVIGVENPRVALVNVGAEDEKGNALAKAVFPLLAQSGLNFVGNVEGRDLLNGDVDVIVCDGFSGNLILKNTEGVAELLTGMMKQEFLADFRSKIGALLLKPALRRFKKRMDYTEHGGAPLLGVSGVIVKAHGSSNAKAFSKAIEQARKIYEGHVVEKIRESLEAREAKASAE